MQIKITFGNARARVIGLSPEQKGQLQRLIAVREVHLPPSRVQGMIKGFVGNLKRRRGADIEYRMFMKSHTDALAREGYADRLTLALFKAGLYSKGTWDGWRSLVASDGSFGSGLVDHVTRALTLRMGLPAPTVVDQRQRPRPPAQLWVPPVPSLFRFQHDALHAWLDAGGRGVLDLPPRSGKTRIMIAGVQHLMLPTLIVVPKVTLVEQTVQRFLELGFRTNDVMGLTGGVSRLSKKRKIRLQRSLVWVATPGTAVKLPGIKSRQVLMIDEFHRSAAKTYQQISIAAENAYYRMGCTGTHYRADGKDLAMHSVLARAVYSRTPEEMVALGRLVPCRVLMVRLPPSFRVVETGRALYGAGISRCAERNAVMIGAAAELIRHGKRVLILTKEVEHSREIARALGPTCLQVDGSDNSQVAPALEALAAGTARAVCGTNVIGEGVDIPSADALVYAAGGRSKVRVVQDFYRVLTGGVAGKTHGIVVDCADNHNDHLVEAAARRLALYRRCFEALVVDSSALGTAIAQAVSM